MSLTWYAVKKWIHDHAGWSIVVGICLFFLFMGWFTVALFDHQKAHMRYKITSVSGEWVAWDVSYNEGCVTLRLVDGSRKILCGTFEVDRLPDE